MDNQEQSKLYGDGWDAYWKHIELTGNPYDNVFDQERADAWLDGWLAAQSADKNGL